MREKFYVLHPGIVISRNDGQEHYISAPILATLYRVRMDECVISRDTRYYWHNYDMPSELFHLYPLYSGEYDRVRREVKRRLVWRLLCARRK